MLKSFDDVWQDIIEIIEADKVVPGLFLKKSFSVEQINAAGLMIGTESGLQPLAKEEIKDAWEAFSSKGSIVADSFPGTEEFRPFIMALLARLPYVKSTSSPEKLYFFPISKEKRPPHASCLKQCIPAELLGASEDS